MGLRFGGVSYCPPKEASLRIHFGKASFLNFSQFLEDIAIFLLFRGTEGAGALGQTLHMPES